MEMLALHFLENNGYTVIERNFNMRAGELDIIAEDCDELVIIEVKYRSKDYCGKAEEAERRKKINNLVKTARYYIYKHPEYKDFNVRFDVLAINGDRIELIKNAFDAY